MLQKRSKWESDTNELLRQKKSRQPERIFFFKRVKRNSIPREKSKLYDQFKYLNNAVEAPQIYVKTIDDNDDLNVPITEGEVRLRTNKI